MRPSKKIINQIVSVMQNLTRLKGFDDQASVDIPVILHKKKIIHVKNPAFQGTKIEHWTFPEIEVKFLIYPKQVVEKAKEFVLNAQKNTRIEYWNRAVYYYPSLSNFSEIGVVDYLECLIKKVDKNK